jgi:uncharacterized protein
MSDIQHLKPVIENMIKSMVDRPEAVDVRIIESTHVGIVEIETDRDDVGKLIGKQGATAMGLRTVIKAMGGKLHKRLTVEIVEDRAKTVRE